MYSNAVLLKRKNDNPKKYDSLLDDEEASEFETSSESVSPKDVLESVSVDGVVASVDVEG